MALRRRSERHGLRVLGIGLLILGSIRIPLPQADYHNVRHHDGPGEVCVYHEHLLRWHPSAIGAADVAVLHWHWVAPLVEPGTWPEEGDARSPGAGPGLHAHLGDWPGPDWTGSPDLSADSRGRPQDSLALGRSMPSSLFIHAPYPGVDPNLAAFLAGDTSCAAGPRAANRSLLSRWNC